MRSRLILAGDSPGRTWFSDLSDSVNAWFAAISRANAEAASSPWRVLALTMRYPQSCADPRPKITALEQADRVGCSCC